MVKTFLADEVLVVVEMGAPAGILEGILHKVCLKWVKNLRIAKRNRKNNGKITIGI